MLCIFWRSHGFIVCGIGSNGISKNARCTGKAWEQIYRRNNFREIFQMQVTKVLRNLLLMALTIAAQSQAWANNTNEGIAFMDAHVHYKPKVLYPFEA